MSKSLFNIEADLLALDQLIEEREGDISDPAVESAVVAWFESLKEDEGRKLDGYCFWIKALEGEAKTAKAEADNYAAKARSRENRAKWLKDRLKLHLELTGQKKIETPKLHTISIVANGGSLPVVLSLDFKIDDVPSQFVKVTKSIDTDAVRIELQAGNQLPFATLGPRGQHLRIK